MPLGKENFISYIFLNSFKKIIWVWKLPNEIFDTISMVIQSWCVTEENLEAVGNK